MLATLQMMTSTKSVGTLGSVVYLIAVTLYQGNQDKNSGISSQLRDRYTPHAGATGTKRSPKKSSINFKKTKQTLTKRYFFYMRQQSTKCMWRIEKPLNFTGIWEHFVQPPPLQCT